MDDQKKIKLSPRGLSAILAGGIAASGLVGVVNSEFDIAAASPAKELPKTLDVAQIDKSEECATDALKLRAKNTRTTSILVTGVGVGMLGATLRRGRSKDKKLENQLPSH